MRVTLLIAGKDLLQRFRDRSVFIWGIVAPLGLAAVFTFLLGSVSDPSNLSVSYAVADLDGGTLSTAFVDQLRGIDLFDLEEVVTAEKAEDLAAAGTVDAAFVIPKGFTASVEAGGLTTIEVIGFVDSPTFTQVARSIAGQFAGEINYVGAAVATEAAVSGGPLDSSGIQAAAAVPPPLELGEIARASKMLPAETFYSAGMAILFLFLTVQFGVLGLLDEKRMGTMHRLLAAPISRTSIVGGKTITSFTLGVVSMAVIVAGTTLMLGADWGNPLGVAVLVVAAVCAAMGVMFVVAAFARTPEQASNLQTIVAFLLAMLGGSFFPVAGTGWLGTVSLLTPHAWFLRGLGDLAAGGTVADALPAAGWILLFAVVTGGPASLRIRKAVQL
jgi:ABC-2 type transport system permease protein